MNKLTKKKDKIFYENGDGLCWVKYKEEGCPMKREDYLLTENEIIGIAKRIENRRMANYFDRAHKLAEAELKKNG